MAEQLTGDTHAAATTAARRWRRAIAGVLVALLAVGGIGQFLFLQPLPRHPNMRTPRDYGMEYREVTLHPAEGARAALALRAWYIPGTRAETVVLCHGRGDTVAGLLPVTRIVHDLGYTAMPIEFRAHGTSDGTWSTVGAAEQRDLTAALDWLDANAPAPVAAFGYSMGGGVALCVAARDARIRGVVTEGAVDDLPRLVRRWYGPLGTAFLAAGTPWIRLRTGVTPWDARPVRTVHTIAPRPLLFIHSRADRVVPFAAATRLYEAAGEPKTLWALDDAPHVGGVVYEADAYRARLARFLNRVFAGDA